MPEVLIIGGGVAGLEAALTLAEHEIESVIIEKELRLGGKASLYNCKAVDGVCQACGACLAGQRVRAVEEQELVKALVAARVAGMRNLQDGLEVDVETPNGRLTFQVRGIIVAAGIDTFSPALRAEFGYSHLPGVVTALEIEGIIRESPEILGESPRLAFIQCFGSREVGAGVPYCSRVCCLYVPKLAGLVKGELPGSRVDIYFMDRQRYEALYRPKTSFCTHIRAMPSKVHLMGSKELEVIYDDPETRKPTARRYDWVVLCPGLVPGKDLPSLASLLELGTGRGGFLQVGAGGTTNRDRVLAAGACTGPMSIIESIASGRAAAGKMASELRRQR